MAAHSARSHSSGSSSPRTTTVGSSPMSVGKIRSRLSVSISASSFSRGAIARRQLDLAVRARAPARRPRAGRPRRRSRAGRARPSRCPGSSADRRRRAASWRRLARAASACSCRVLTLRRTGAVVSRSAVRSTTASRVSLPTSHSSIASTARHVAFGRCDSTAAKQADLDRLLRDAQRLEHAVRRVLEDVGEHAVAVEHAQHAVDLGRDLLAERLDALDVLLEDRRRRQRAGSRRARPRGSARRRRTARRATAGSAGGARCPRGAKSKRASVHSRSWWSAAWPWIRPTCAEVTSPSKNRTSPRRRPRISVRTRAAAERRRARGRACRRRSSRRGCRRGGRAVPAGRRAGAGRSSRRRAGRSGGQQDLVGAGRLERRRGATPRPGEHDRDVELRGVERARARRTSSSARPSVPPTTTTPGRRPAGARAAVAAGSARRNAGRPRARNRAGPVGRPADRDPGR